MGKAQSVTFWVLGILVAYILSVGPVVGMASRRMIPEAAIPSLIALYEPLDLATREPAIRKLINGYINLWMPRGSHV